MNKEEARQLFPLALRDEMSAEQAAAFEQALTDFPGLEAEFEAFADTEAGGGVENLNTWLKHTAATAASTSADTADTYRELAQQVIQRAQGRKRGRLISLLGAAGAAVAAAAVVAVLVFPAGAPSVEDWPENTPGQVVVLSDGYRHYESAIEEFHPAEGVTLGIDSNTLIRPFERGARLDRGSVRVTLDEGASYHIAVGDHRVEAQGPGEFEITAEPHRYPDTSFMKLENDPMLDSRILSRFGAKGFAMALTVVAGSATLHGAQAPQVVNAPQTIQANPGPGQQAPKPPKPEDIFDHLDANSDGVLDSNEVPAQMITDFDDDGSGDIDLAEFKAHHKPPLPPNPNDAFKVLDKNGDGVLDNVEVDQKMITDFDDDGSGDVDLTEFTAHYKPKPRTAQDEFDHLDVNGDGVLDANEIPQKLLNDLDKDNSGDVDLNEFTPHWQQHNPPPGPQPGAGFDHIDLNGDGVLDNTEVPQDMINKMDQDNSGDIDRQEFIDGHKPPKPEDVFDNLDANSDGVLDSTEADAKMIQDFDDDGSGDIDLNEFKAHWRPHPRKPEDIFRDLDKNGDGELDTTELPTAHVNDWDDDGNGTVDLTEFRAHHPKPPGGPGGPGGKGPGGPGGPGGKGPGGPGGGPGGPGGPGGGPGGPGGKGPGGKGPGPKPPRPPHK